MSIITGVKQKAQTYQIMMKNNNNNNFIINNDISSNLLNFNLDVNSHSNAIINFTNKYHLGIVDNKICINNININNNKSNNLLTIDNSNLYIYKDANFLSNLNIDNYLYTSNNTTYFNNNLLFKLNNNDTNFKIINNSSTSLFEINKNNLDINILTNFNSNIRMSPNSTLFTNFIDSPNNKPVIIQNLAFAESLRILTNNIIHNISVDNSIIWCNIYDFKPDTLNRLTPIDDELWTQYMINNNINLTDTEFTKPNISVSKYVTSRIGGSNILEFKTRKLNDGNNSNLVFSINNNGYINIGSNYTSNIPINININPSNSNCFNIFQYLNKNNSTTITTINSNGYINIGSNNFSQNQINISKNFNSNLNNTELISLNINTNNFNNYSGIYPIQFINNNDYYNFVFKENINLDDPSVDIIDIIITNPFIESNVKSVNNNIYDISITNFNYLSSNYSLNNKNIQTNIKYPSNTFNLFNNNINLDFYIYPLSITNIANIANPNLFNIKIFNISQLNKNYIYKFYIYKSNYSYNYNGIYKPLITDYIKFNSNNNNSFSISANGNTGIGTYYSDIYKLYIPENALINNINCSTIDNIITKNISFLNSSLNNINTLNCDLINNNIIYSSSNITSNIQVINSQIINSNLTVLNNINVSSNINISNNAIILNSNIILNNNNANIQIKTNNVNSIPYLSLNNNTNKYDISINSNNNFQILLNNTNSIIENNYLNNSISLIGSSFNVFRDTNSNVKIFAGRSRNINGNSIDNWYNYISGIGNENYNNNKSLFYIYGNFFLNDPVNGNPMIHSYLNTNNYLKIGIGTVNNDISDKNLMIINLDTNFNSNITVNNNIYLKGTILSPSDSNIKTDINIISSPLEKINKINGYTYKRTDTGIYETGLIAQEVLEILPEVVKYNNDIYNISYGNMCGLLVEAIKELNKKIEKLEGKI